MNTKHALVSSGLGILFLLTALPAISDTNFSITQELIIPVDAKNKIVGVRIGDIVSSYPSLIPGMAKVA